MLLISACWGCSSASLGERQQLAAEQSRLCTLGADQHRQQALTAAWQEHGYRPFATKASCHAGVEWHKAGRVGRFAAEAIA